MEYASKLADRVVDFVLDVSFRHIGYIIRYERRVEELKKGVEALEHERKRVEHKVDDAKNNVKGIEPDVEAWFEEVEVKIKESKDFKDDEAHTKTGCSRGILPCLWYRHRLGRKARKLEIAVKAQKEKSKFDGVAYQQNPGSADIALSNAGYVEFGSRKKTMEEIMRKLEDSTVRMIGVHGPGGVGKTTFVKEIAKKARDNKLFNAVVIVSITKNPNCRKIQQEIADHLGLTFEGEGEYGRADRLRRRFRQANENTLVILDDLWDGLDLNMLGIPLYDNDDLGHVTAKDRKDIGYKMGGEDKSFGDYDGEKFSLIPGSKSGTSFGDDECLSQVSVTGEKDFSHKMTKNDSSSGAYSGCKILLTSRDKEVLSAKMNVKENSIFSVTELDDEEAVTLFKKVAEIPDESSKFRPEIFKKYCAGLPMAILAVGRALRNKSELVWEDVQEKFKRQELMGVQKTKTMDISVRMSYDHLESEELKSVFLLCAQMGHQPLIMELVKYCVGLGILKGVHTLRDARDRICESIQKLKDSSLMLDGNASDHFNMHDLVRDAALSIAHKDQNVFTLRNDRLDDWPDELERCTAISVYKSDIVDELPKVMNCPQLRVFHIDCDDPSLNIPDGFFEGMGKLRVLILTGFHLRTLPSSIKCLSNLRMLCLERCVLGNLSDIRDMKKLRILSLAGSKIKHWPAELGGLSKVQLLDISDCSIGNMIPPNFISSLTSLEELYISTSMIKSEVEGETKQSQFSVLSDLKHLHQLKNIDVCIPSAEVFPLDVFFDKLNAYKIVIGDFTMLSVGDFKMPNKYEASRSLALELKSVTDIHSLKGIKMLFKRVENLLLGELNGVKNAIYELNLDGFPHLKYLSIINNHGIEYIVNPMELSHPLNVFPSLESFNLFNMANIRKICCSPVTDASFSRLKIIKVKMCTQLKNLISLYIVKFLISLETIDVSQCDYLEEIVGEEGGEVSDKVEFCKLCSLTLQELPLFIRFYANEKMLSEPQFMDRQAEITEIAYAEDDQNVTTCIFGEKVEFPNLESLKLSSLNVNNIWSGKLSRFCFQNLVKLTVEDCCNLTYLCSLFVASNLKKLKALSVSGCQMMKELFSTEGNSIDFSKVCIFPKLEEIQITNMNMLKDIWPAKVSVDSFPSLISVHIEGCKQLEKIFPSHMEGWYQTLDSLKVVSCQSVEVIFEIGCTPQKKAFGDGAKLQLILLKWLKSLKDVWRIDQERVVNFTNLRSIKVLSCKKLSNVLPASVAKDLVKLEDLSVQSCDGIEEIVAWFEGSESSNPLMFPAVTSMEFSDLPNIRHFYMGTLGKHSVECPKLKQLTVNDCAKLEIFTTESSNKEGRPVFLAEKVISNLEYMDIGSKEAEWLMRNIGEYFMFCLKQLRLHSLPSVETLYWFLHRIPNLERLYLDCPNIQEFVPSGNTATQQRLGTVLQLKELALYTPFIKDIGFERDLVLQRIERLVVFSCHSLINLVHSSVFLNHLTYLEVNWCPGLKILMASSTAKSLVQLTTMKVIGCDKLKEIVTNEGNEEQTEVNIKFGKLITIELANLKDLTSFCSYKNFKFFFPSLEKLILRGCPKMKTFTESEIEAPKLQNILATEEEEENKRYWEGDLNATIKKVFANKVSFEYTSRLELSSYPELEQVWCGKGLVQHNFHNLKTLVVEKCDYLVHGIPYHLLPCFKNLEELVVRSCRAVQVIFNIVNDNGVIKAPGMFRLKKLSLSDLPKLEHVWDKDPRGIVGLQVLQDLSVQNCDSLKYVFPASVAKDLAMLKKLDVGDCDQLVEIFSEDEKAPKSFVFQCLTSLELTRLPGLKFFHRGLRMLEFPMLKELHIDPCKWEILDCQEAYPEVQGLTPHKKVNLLMCSLEKLSFDVGYASVICDLKSQKLKLKYLKNFKELSDNGLYQLLKMAPSVEKLEIVMEDFSSEQLFYVKRPNADHAGVLSNLKGLMLVNLYLKSIGLEHSWVHSIPKYLQTLELKYCYHLKNLVRCTVSFSNLTNLVVSSCNKLCYLFTSSTAKSLARLKRMEIRNCKSMQEVVVSNEEGDESHESGNIIFEQLQALYLEKLPKLTCFYSGDLTLCFPSLEQVSLTNCLLMKMFCPLIEINKDSNKLLSGVGLIKDATRWEGDLNTTICKMNEKQIAESAREDRNLELGGSSRFQEMWQGSMPVPDACFSNLKSLIVDGCEFLSQVLPSHLLPFLSKMQKLVVRNCSSVKTIFDVKCIKKGKSPLLFSLNHLVLTKLPNLECVWNEDPDGILRFQLLQQVSVDTCKCLTSLFPASVAKDLVNLGNLSVIHCEGLVEIVEGTNLAITFPCLTSLTLLDLPKLKCFYCSLCCLELKTFTGKDPHIEDQVCVKEITPNMDNLSLGEKELTKIWHGQCQGNHLHKVKVLDLQGFNVADEVPCGFLQRVPNTEKLVVSDSSSLKEIFCSERPPNVDYTEFLPQLKGLELGSLSELISIGLEHSWVQESFLKNLETLKASSCPRLRKLVPSPVCFSNLTYLTVYNCDDMVHLFTSSTAKSLTQLKHMDIGWCKSIQEIVSKEGDDEPHDDDDEIIFGQLEALRLYDLRNLRSFYNGSDTLSFPSLESLSVIKCSRMDTFCVGTLNANKLSAVELNYEDAPLKVDLNFTICKAFKAKVEDFVKESKDLKLVDHPEVYEIWRGSLSVPFKCFIKLKSLIMERCDFLSNAIPSHILGLLSNLEELHVKQCESVKSIFEVKDITKDTKKLNTGHALSQSFRLKKLTLEQLPNLEHVWDSDSQQVIGLIQNLQEVYVHGCDNLERLFPASVAKCFGKLEKLEVKQCGRLVEIVAKDEAAAAEEAPKEFSLPCMTSIKLLLLPELKCFYPGPHKLECPELKQVQLFHCGKLKTFTCESQSFLAAQSDYQVGTLLHQQALFLADKVLPYLEFLAVSKEEAMTIWHEQFHGNHLHKLQALQLQCFHDDSDTFPYELLQQVPNIEKLIVSCSSFKEIFFSETPNLDCAEEVLSHLKRLQLSSLSDLSSIGLEHSWVDPISGNLEELQIEECHCLRNIVPCKVSFSSLVDLDVSKCGGLVSLFTPSTGRSLLQLKKMSVRNCEALEEIIVVSEEVKEEGSSKHDEEEKIIFKKLETLCLESLPRLGSFYNGSVALSFPSLDELSVIDCRRMESFCAGPISVNKFTSFKFWKYMGGVPLVVDLNYTIRKVFDGTLF